MESLTDKEYEQLVWESLNIVGNARKRFDYSVNSEGIVLLANTILIK